MIEIKCLDCRNCTGDSCKVYGSDADKAVKSCADDSFRNYKARMTREGTIEIIKHLRSIVSSEDYIEAFDMVIKALEKPERKWIPVSERLPKPNKAVLICTNTGEIEVDYYGSCTKDFIGLKGTHMKAAAWQPLPEPYEAGEE